ncbi:MAG: nitrate- and nitrite sensing domain-containing protein, partial [Campylobacterota bacterium]
MNLAKFDVLASDKVKEFYRSTYKGESVNKIITMMDIARSKGMSGGFGVDSSVWFNEATTSIDLLRSVEIELYKEVLKLADKKIVDANTSLISVASFSLVLVIALFILAFYMVKNITGSLSHIQQGLNRFFSFLNHETDKAELINIESKDEFGEMAKVINENIRKIELEIVTDAKFIEDVQNVMDRVQNGWFSQHIEANSNSASLQNLKITVNQALKNLRANFVTMNGILEEYCNYNYTKELKLENIEKDGVFDTLLNDINRLRDAITAMLSYSLTNGIDLQNDASSLKQAVESLSTASNQQAASLEETAAAMEEMTSNVQNNVAKSNEMATMATQ